MDPTWDLGLLRAYFLNRCDAPTTVMMESHCHLGHPFLQNINELGRPGDLSGKKETAVLSASPGKHGFRIGS